MIKYPFLKKGATIGVTAPSSGVKAELHPMLKQTCESMERKGYKVVCGETVWTQEKAKSASAKKRANEFMEMMQNENIDIIIPPWGGELLIEILEEIDFEKINKKWVLGYSDTSVLLLAITLNTGIATAHGTNLVDLRGEYSDETTAMWETVLSTETEASVIQYSSSKYQKKWQHDNPSPCVFHLTEDTYWKTISTGNVKIKGRLLGGCIDVIRHLIGTPYGRVQEFRKKHFDSDPLIWYLENCELTTTDLRRSLVQMKLAGWFDHCSGILFGRSAANHPVDDYTVEDVYKELADELQIPIVYDIDCGHVPPQITFIHGAFAEVEVENGKGVVIQHFKP
ncbi:S66 family peptidase [Parageobacillus thermoglucosidasius]|uniref:Peptidase S66 n=1 Tax=Parageobacillus thermoglucosidasius TaxID=1426 RepID=A0AAN1D785_PARTM|nr:S66 peptidase family protein [Parageobacillus thermoglucosidasius]ALF10882.1 peptidase S66 [Parageobacillus thermoglucosidasius]ANZ30959.1 peptidase S66 [Parageobacillus thermoglucosidasius]APM81696.1 peptidase S66 [Parageobacillus thermoglucosidasius]KJX69151.1 peptidase S66 [Parageobacillus thermoglucosidasius]RDE25428.1 LD-carboxypeptidase [Parageobacillus thermoglucosidasius]